MLDLSTLNTDALYSRQVYLTSELRTYNLRQFNAIEEIKHCSNAIRSLNCEILRCSKEQQARIKASLLRKETDENTHT